MSDYFFRLFADGGVRQAPANVTPNRPHGRRRRNECLKIAVLRTANIFEVLLSLGLYGAIITMAFIALIMISVSVALTSPVWVPCGIMCLPPIILIVILFKFTTIPTRSANSVKESGIMKNFSWNSIFGIATT